MFASPKPDANATAKLARPAATSATSARAIVAPSRSPRHLGNQAILRRAAQQASTLETPERNALSLKASPDFRTTTVLQPKLAIGAANGPLEHEADRAAEQVMRMPDPALSVTTTAPAIRRKCAACGDEERQVVQAKTAGSKDPAGEAPAIVHDVLGQSGQPLDPAARAFMEPRFGRDFGDVRVHTGGSADAACRSIDALAYATGPHLVFGEGQYQPGSTAGRHLLSHELAHVIQQGAAPRLADSPGPDRAAATEGATVRRQTTGPEPAPARPAEAAPERKCGPDITNSLTSMMGRVETYFRGLTGFQQNRSCTGLGPAGPLVFVNPGMAWDTWDLFLPNTGWLDFPFRSDGCGSPRDPGCATDDTRNLCETAGTCGNSVVFDNKCMLAGTANYALFGKMCRLCHDYTGTWGRGDMRAIIWAYKVIPDDPGPPMAMATAAYDGTLPSVPAAAENRGSCNGRCGVTHRGAFDFIWEPYKPRT